MSDETRHYCVVLTRRKGVPREEFLRAWLGEHRELALELPGILEARFMPTVDEGVAADGVGLLSFASNEAMRTALDSDVARRLREHTATFADSAAATRLILRDG